MLDFNRAHEKFRNNREMRIVGINRFNLFIQVRNGSGSWEQFVMDRVYIVPLICEYYPDEYRRYLAYRSDVDNDIIKPEVVKDGAEFFYDLWNSCEAREPGEAYIYRR